MTRNSTRLPVLGSDAAIAVGLVDEWFDPIEAGLRDRVRDFIQRMIESELDAVLSRRAMLAGRRGIREQGRGRCRRPPARSPIALASGELWPGGDRRAAGKARHRGGQDHRMEEHGAAGHPSGAPSRPIR